MTMKFLWSFLMFWGVMSVFAQSEPSSVNQEYAPKIIFQVATSDTMAHGALTRQLNNIITAAPKAQIEVMCHGPGMSFIHKEKSTVLNTLSDLAERGIDFVGCEFTMKMKNIKREQLLNEARTVPGGILEIVDKQNQGYAYIKAGN